MLAVAVTSGTASAADPKAPPAAPNAAGTKPIAILTTGFDYTRPEIAAHLARDGEGELMAWDVPGNDRFPYDQGGDTQLVLDILKALPAAAPVSLLPVRIDLADPISLGKAIAFLARTPVDTVLVPLWSSQSSAWTIFAQAAAHFPRLRLVVRTCPDIPISGGERVFPRDLQLPNANTADPPAVDSTAAIEVYLAALPCRRP